MVFFSIAAGQNTTFFLAKPNSKMSDLPRHPLEVDTPAACVACGMEDEGEEEEQALQCDKVSGFVILCLQLLTSVISATIHII